MKYEFHPEAEQELHEAAARYELEVPELGFRFADEVEGVIRLVLEDTELGSRLDDVICATSCFAGFRSLSCTRTYRMSFALSPSLREVASPAIGDRVSKTADKLFEPMCERLAARQWP